MEHTNPFVRARSLVILSVSLGLMLLSMSVAQAGTSLPKVVTKHVMWGAGQGYPSTSQASTDNMIYHGGLVETVPAVYIVYWGPEWTQGFFSKQGSFTYTSAGWVEFAGLILSQVGNFSVKGTIEKHYNVSLSGMMTIFFSAIYFQYHFDRLAKKD